MCTDYTVNILRLYGLRRAELRWHRPWYTIGVMQLVFAPLRFINDVWMNMKVSFS